MADLLDIVTADDLKPFGDIAAAVEAVASIHAVTAGPEPIDAFAADVTRLCDQVVTFDRTEMLLIKLTRAGIIDDGQCFALHAAYLAQRAHRTHREDEASAAMRAEREALEKAAQNALERRRASGQVLFYELDGWKVYEHPDGRIERLAPSADFRAEDHPFPGWTPPETTPTR